MSDGPAAAWSSVRAAIRRGGRYRHAFGWSRFAWRLIRVWLWVPKLLEDRRWQHPRPAAAMRPFGVNLAGYLRAENGLGESARLRAEALGAAGVPCALNPVLEPDLANHEPLAAPPSPDNPYRFNLVWVNASKADDFARQVGPGYFAGRYNIGYWVWEMPEFPEDRGAAFRYYDEIWVPSRFVEACIAPRSPVPVLRIPHTIRPRRRAGVSAVTWRARAGVPEGAFLFLFVFHFHGLFERKNPLALIEAFTEAFGGGREAFLLIKTAGGLGHPGLALMREAAGAGNIGILDGVVRRHEIDALLEASDAYVSLHRSEGFGLTLVEAMARAKPVIATGYGGNTDFMTARNSYLVNHRLVELSRDTGPYRRGWRWAEPDVADAAALMRRVFERRDEARRVGERARRDVHRQLHPARIGRLVRQRLDAIAASRSGA
jgi:glycosyltransferase involved in cell wall biosynthesis